MAQHELNDPAGDPSEGQRSPRVRGAFVALIGVGFLALNAALIRFVGIYYPTVIVIGCIALGFGAWIIATGRTFEAGRDEKPPVWWMIGAGLSAVSGFGAGIYLSSLLGG